MSVALAIQHAMCMRHILLPSVAGPSDSTIFFHIISQMAQFSEKKVLTIKCVLIFVTTWSEIFLSLRRNERDIITNQNTHACKVPNILVRF